MAEPLVGVVMGSASDWSTMQAAVAVLERFERRPRGARRQRPPDARRDVRVRRGGGRSRAAGDHRRRRRRGPPARDARRQDDRARARRAGPVPPPAGPGLAAVDRADAGGHPGGDVRHRRGRGHQRRPVRRGDARHQRPRSLDVALRRLPRPSAATEAASARRCRHRDRRDRPAGDDRHARRRPARPLHGRRRPADGLRHDRARSRSARAGRARRRRAPRRRLRRSGCRSTALAARCAVVTTEFENPPAGALERLAADVAVAPPAAAVAIAQDRIAEKRFLAELGVPTAPFAVPARLATAGVALPGDRQDRPARLRRQGPARRRRRPARRRGVGRARPCRASSSSGCRSTPRSASSSPARPTARRSCYPVAENHHVGRHPRSHGRAGPRSTPALAAEAVALADAVAAALDYVGVLAVEMFVSDGRLLVNELAPAPAQQRPLDPRRRRHQPVRAAGPRRVRAGARATDD